MAIGGSFGGAGNSFGGNNGYVAPINTGATDYQGRKSGDLGFTRFFPGVPQTAPTSPLMSEWWQANNVQGKTSIPGAPTPSISQPQVDFFKQYGGYEGLLGLAPGTLSKPGSFKLSDVLGIKPQPVDNSIQYSPEAATQNQAQMLGQLVNGGKSQYNFSTQPGGSPLSPPNSSGNTKGPMPSNQTIQI